MVSKNILKLVSGLCIFYSDAMCMNRIDDNTISNEAGVSSKTMVIDSLWGNCFYKEEDIKDDKKLVREHITIDDDHDCNFQVINCLPFKIRVQKQKCIDSILSNLTRMCKIYALTVDVDDSLTAENLKDYALHDCIVIDQEALLNNVVDVDSMVNDYYAEYGDMLSGIGDHVRKRLVCSNVLGCCKEQKHHSIASKNILEHILSTLKAIDYCRCEADFECCWLMEQCVLDMGLTSANMMDSQVFTLHLDSFKAYIKAIFEIIECKITA